MSFATVPAPGRPTSLAGMAAETPASRDRYVDFLRAASIAVVVFGHWLMAIVYMRDGTVTGESALDAIPGLWILTWVLQVMPLFFFVGGFSNLTSIEANRRRDGTYIDFVRTRVERLTRPTMMFVAVWMAVSLALTLLAPGLRLAEATGLLAKPVWFLAVYVLVVVLSPVMLALHRRFGVKVLVALAAGAVVVDVLRVTMDAGAIGYLNFAFVWLFPHQLGFFYGDGSLTRRSRRVYATLAGAGLALLTGLVGTGIYAPSMVGTMSDRLSNNDPPSVCLIALTVWLVGSAMLLRAPVSRVLQRPRAWTAVIAANSMIMTVFLWHLTALAVAVLVAYPLGFPQFEGGTTAWWISRPAWLAVLTVALVPFVALFGRFERPRPARRDVEVPPRVVQGVGVAVATVFIVLGLAGFAQGGFATVIGSSGTAFGAFEVNGVLNIVHLTLGIYLLGGPPSVRASRAASLLLVLACLEALLLPVGLVIPISATNIALHVACGAVLVGVTLAGGRTPSARRSPRPVEVR